ncbi:MAG: hypothetical protein IKD75_06980 [Prevotella sp.]|jgi:ppGpp synthetase/RelA/SpoT-type nucleotidyltranferase|nr:hypothetical protein [Prevotella sp.]
MEQLTLDAHGEELLRQYEERLPIYERMEKLAYDYLRRTLRKQGIYVTSIEHRIKEKDSLRGKLELKGGKYATIEDVTDILGLRVITFYTDDVDKVAAIVKRTFSIDWKESVDKRKLHQMDSFGYNSLHYICRLPKTIVDDPEMPALNKIRFELQMRTTLQHVWSTIEHDTGYKGDVKIPPEYKRQFSRLAGMLELIDDEFSRLRTTLTDYRRKVQSLVASGKLDDVLLDTENFRSFMKLRPFDRLNKRIAAINQAEIYPVSLLCFIPVLKSFGFNTLGDVQQFMTNYEEEAYQLAVSQLAFTDLDILSENVGLLNLCIVYVIKNGGGITGLKRIFSMLYGNQDINDLAELAFKQASTLSFMQNKEYI